MKIRIRHDGGDAETGFGADIGARIAWSDAERGLSAEIIVEIRRSAGLEFLRGRRAACDRALPRAWP